LFRIVQKQDIISANGFYYNSRGVVMSGVRWSIFDFIDASPERKVEMEKAQRTIREEDSRGFESLWANVKVKGVSQGYRRRSDLPADSKMMSPPKPGASSSAIWLTLAREQRQRNLLGEMESEKIAKVKPKFTNPEISKKVKTGVINSSSVKPPKKAAQPLPANLFSRKKAAQLDLDIDKKKRDFLKPFLNKSWRICNEGKYQGTYVLTFKNPVECDAFVAASNESLSHYYDLGVFVINSKTAVLLAKKLPGQSQVKGGYAGMQLMEQEFELLSNKKKASVVAC
jgi:hypothetical protein